MCDFIGLPWALAAGGLGACLLKQALSPLQEMLAFTAGPTEALGTRLGGSPRAASHALPSPRLLLRRKQRGAFPAPPGRMAALCHCPDLAAGLFLRAGVVTGGVKGRPSQVDGERRSPSKARGTLCRRRQELELWGDRSPPGLTSA